jgi:hypothetical protein
VDSEVVGVDNTQGPVLNPQSWLYGSKFTKLTLGSKVAKVGDFAFAECASLEDVTISEGVQSIGRNAFANAKIRKISLPKSVASIGCQAFWGCTGELLINSKVVEADCSLYNAPTDEKIGWLGGAKFSSVIIGNDVEKIGAYAFANWASLKKVELSKSVVAVGYGAFVDSGITKLLIAKQVASIGYNAFKGCTHLTTILSEAQTPPQLGEEAFAGCAASCRIYVPEEAVEAYKESWKEAFGKHPHIASTRPQPHHTHLWF